jgi:uncharacterized protein (DUF1499 family)
MRPNRPLGPSIFARWTSRIAVFSAVLLITAAFLHRLFGLPTPEALNLAYVAFAGAIFSLLLALVATIGIWRTGRPGVSRVVFGTLVGLGLLLWPMIFLRDFEQLPKINDVTTDTVTPPPFIELAKARGPSANSTDYPGESFALKQAVAYPDIRPIKINRSSEEAFELATDAVRRLDMKIVRQEAPNLETGKPGVLEVVDRTMILGFYDDVAIRVTGDANDARIDVRSASRYGTHDLGRNAERTRRILKEIITRLESVVPARKEKVAETTAKEKPKVKKRRRRSRRSRRRRRR